MAQYKSKTVTVCRPAAYIMDKFADFSAFGGALDNLPEAERQRIGDVTFEKDSIKIDTKQVGMIEFRVVNRTADRVEMQAVGSPVPLSLIVRLQPVGEEQTEIETEIDVDIPPMLRPLIGGAMQKAVDQFGDLMARLNA